MFGLDAEIVHGSDDFQSAEHAENAVIFAAGRLCIEVRADIDGQGVRVCSRPGHEHVAHGVDRHGHAGFLAPFLEQLAALGVGIGQGLAIVATGNTRTDLCHLHQTVPEAFCVDPQVFAGGCHACVS